MTLPMRDVRPSTLSSCLEYVAMTLADMTLQGWRAVGAGTGHAAGIHDTATARAACAGHRASGQPPANHRREARSAAAGGRGAGRGRRSTAAGNARNHAPTWAVNTFSGAHDDAGIVLMLDRKIVTIIRSTLDARHAVDLDVSNMERAGSSAGAVAAAAGYAEGGTSTRWRRAAGHSFPACDSATAAGVAQRSSRGVELRRNITWKSVSAYQSCDMTSHECRC